MSQKDTEPIRIETRVGEILIYPRCHPGFFGDLVLDSGLGRFAHYSSIIQKLDVFEKLTVEEGSRVLVALTDAKMVVAYMTCLYPEPGDRWRKLDGIMYEFSAIEVSRNFRKLGLAGAMMNAAMADGSFEEKISYINGYCWHWDSDGSGLSLVRYRKMLLEFLKPFGFQEYYTNEPNIAIREENLFMARVGSRVSAEDQQRFRKLRFGIVDWK
ncbi:MAG: N-acetyltransferase [Desulfomonilaceae bacterium]